MKASNLYKWLFAEGEHMKIKEFIENWKAGNMPVSTKSNITLSEGYRAYWELKQEMWKRTKFNPLKK